MPDAGGSAAEGWRWGEADAISWYVLYRYDLVLDLFFFSLKALEGKGVGFDYLPRRLSIRQIGQHR